MRKRAFVPESLSCLEGRTLLSGGAKTPHGAAPLSAVGFGLGNLRTQGYFQQYALGGNFKLLKTQIAATSSAIPYGRIDGLPRQASTILNQMRQDQANSVPGAISNAYQQLSAGLKADVDARISDGTIVVIDK